MCLQSQAAFNGAPLYSQQLPVQSLDAEDPFVNPIQWLTVDCGVHVHKYTLYYLGGLTVHTSSKSSPPPRGWRWGHHQQFIRQERNYTPDRHRHCIRCGSLVLLLSQGPGQGATKIRYMSGNDDNFITRSCITLHWWR